MMVSHRSAEQAIVAPVGVVDEKDSGIVPRH
jgi:hypothetical protein